MSPTRRFRLSQHGNIVVIHPQTPAAARELRESVDAEGWQWLGSSLAVDARCADSLLSNQEA